MGGALTSVIRTAVPAVAGAVLAVAAWAGMDLDDGAVIAAVTGALTLAWYVVCRGMEVLGRRMGWPWLRTLGGALLGWAREPVYPAPQVHRELPPLDDPAAFRAALRRMGVTDGSGHDDRPRGIP